MKRAYHELEIIRLIKMQRTLRTVLRILFSDIERFLLKNQHSTVLGSSTDERMSSSGSEMNNDKITRILGHENNSVFGKQLLKGARKQHRNLSEALVAKAVQKVQATDRL